MKKPLILFAVLLLISCKNEQKQSNIEQKQSNIPISRPIKIYSNNDVSVNAYDYNSLEPFLKQKNDTTYVINFWATWCEPCVAELPFFEKINAKYKNSKVKVILVSLDMKKQVESRLLPFIVDNKLKSEVVLLSDPDSNTWIPKIDSSWSGAIPATIIYNSTKRNFYEQSFTFDELDKEVQSFIN